MCGICFKTVNKQKKWIGDSWNRIAKHWSLLKKNDEYSGNTYPFVCDWNFYLHKRNTLPQGVAKSHALGYDHVETACPVEKDIAECTEC